MIHCIVLHGAGGGLGERGTREPRLPLFVLSTKRTRQQFTYCCCHSDTVKGVTIAILHVIIWESCYIGTIIAVVLY
jgi:hypothetical protein